jgi:hypothetical protein
MRHDAALNKKLRYLQNRIAMTEALMAFLKKHPAVASRTINWYLSNKPALCFEEKAFIRTMNVKGTDKVVLRLERYVEDFSDGDPENRVVCDDLSDLSPTELGKVLKKVKIDLSKTAEEDEEEDF